MWKERAGLEDLLWASDEAGWIADGSAGRVLSGEEVADRLQ